MNCANRVAVVVFCSCVLWSTTARAQSELVITGPESLSVDILENSGVELPPELSDVSQLPPESVLPVIIDHTQPLNLPPGIVLAPPPAKVPHDVTSRVIEEKLDVLVESGIELTQEQRIAIKSCESALTAYEAARRGYSVGSNTAAIDSLNDLVKAEKEMQDQCIEPVSDASRITAFGVLETSKLGIVCGALLLSSNRIATAYHCLVRPDAQFDELRFRPLREPNRQIELAALVFFPNQENLAPEEAEAVENDFIGADLKQPVAVPPDICLAMTVAPGTTVELVAYWPLKSEGEEFAKSVRHERNSSCRILTVGDSCFAHSCSAIPGQSGSPIFGPAMPNCAGAVVTGLHVNGESLSKTACNTGDSNTAVRASRIALLQAAH